MTNEAPKIRARTLARGELEVGLAAAGQLRWAVADLTQIVERLRQRRDLSPVAAVALGQMLAGAALILRLQSKTPVRVILETRGDGPLGRVTAEADNLGGLRGAVTVPQAAVEGGDAVDAAAGIGSGTLRVIRQMAKKAYESVTPLLEGGGVSHQLTHFLEQSDQTHSAVLLGVLLRPDGVAAAGGLILEALPGADEDLLTLLEKALADVTSVSRCLEEKGREGLLDLVLGQLDRETIEERPLSLICTCDRERLRLHLTGLPAEDREYIFAGDDTGKATVECHFCGAQYHYRPEELSPPQ